MKYEDSIREFNKKDLEEKKRFYSSNNYGIIVKNYPKELEETFYKKLAFLIKKAYPDFSDEEEMFRALTEYGDIFTMKIHKRLGNGFYHIGSGDIGIYAYLNRLSEEAVHEAIHKLGYMRFNQDFYDMPVEYKEVGAELVTNTVLEARECKECIINGLWVRSVGADPVYLLDTALVEQLNFALGDNTLERSVIEGKNFFEPKIENELGIEFKDYFLKELRYLIKYENFYWKKTGKEPNDNARREKVFSAGVSRLQNEIMVRVYDKKSEAISNVDDAEVFLKELLEYSDYRIKRKEESSEGNSRFIDDDFEEYFSEKKKELEERFDMKFYIEYDEDAWKGKYPIIIEKEKVVELIKERKKIDAQVGHYPKIKTLSRLFRKNTLIEGSIGDLEEPLQDSPVSVNDNDFTLFSNKNIKSNLEKTKENRITKESQMEK